MYPIIPVDRQCAEAVEPLGSKWKFWFTGQDRRRQLFKAEERGTGEDWAEKIASELCAVLGIPHVHYEMAALFDEGAYAMPGAVCVNCVPPEASLVLGNQLMLALDVSYPANDRRKYKVRAHTVPAVTEVIRALACPSSEWMELTPPGISTAFDVFLGYLLLDAWIANQDRHHENWGAIRGTSLRLAPTFDHGASFARNVTDDERRQRLSTTDRGYTVEAFAAKARSAFYPVEPEIKKPLGTFDAFEAFALSAPQAALIWMQKLSQVKPEKVREIVSNVPESRMSSTAQDFTVELLLANQRRLQSKSGNV